MRSSAGGWVPSSQVTQPGGSGSATFCSTRRRSEAMNDNYSKWQTREGIKNLPEFDGEHDDQ